MKILAALLASCALSTAALAVELEKGQPFPAYTVTDAFGQTNTLAETTRFVIIASEREVSGKINDWLKTKGPNYLDDRRAEYVSDITTMPGIITTLFALPKMKKYPFKILLADDPAFATTYPSRPGKIALFILDEHHTIADILFADNPAEVEARIGAP